MLKPSTFSIVAYDPADNAWGVAVASKFLAVGAVVPWARAGAGAVATQAYANTTYGPRGLDLMAQGASAEEALQSLLDDDDPDHRQAGMVDARGKAATFTGKECYDWAGGFTGKNFAVQGNILVGEQVVQKMARSFIESEGSLPLRLYRALRAGDLAGGDQRGRQSAALLVVKPEGGYAGFNDRWVDYRVDDHPDPVKRLGEMLELHDLYFESSSEEDKMTLSGAPLEELQRLMIGLGYYQGAADGQYDKETRRALERFVGNENFEDRTDIERGRIDRPVFEYLLRHFQGLEGQVE